MWFRVDLRFRRFEEVDVFRRERREGSEYRYGFFRV